MTLPFLFLVLHEKISEIKVRKVGIIYAHLDEYQFQYIRCPTSNLSENGRNLFKEELDLKLNSLSSYISDIIGKIKFIIFYYYQLFFLHNNFF